VVHHGEAAIGVSALHMCHFIAPVGMLAWGTLSMYLKYVSQMKGAGVFFPS
jgi:hypothetical protein